VGGKPRGQEEEQEHAIYYICDGPALVREPGKNIRVGSHRLGSPAVPGHKDEPADVLRERERQFLRNARPHGKARITGKTPVTITAKKISLNAMLIVFFKDTDVY
jgi:hypothetical protein